MTCDSECAKTSPVTDYSLLWMAGAGLILYSAGLTFLAGNFGFEGDDWWMFSWPYWHGFPASLWIYARESLRPFEGIYWIGLYKLFGFNRIAFHFSSLTVAAGGCLLMGACLTKAFPQRRNFAAAAALIAFFLPTVSCLTYVLSTDNSRLSLLFFWAGVLTFQRWTERRPSWTGLMAPVALYWCAFLTYEAPSLLIVALPLFLLPVRQRGREDVSDLAYWFRVAVGMAAALGGAVLGRFLIMGGGAVPHRHLMPPIELLWSYPALLPHYLAAPFTNGTFEPWSWVLGIGVVLLAALVVYRGRARQESDDVPGGWETGPLYLIGVGAAILVLGMLPYQLAGYGAIQPRLAESALAMWGAIPDGQNAWFNFHWGSRIYSAASFGLAILLAAAATCWTNRTARLFVTGAVIAYLGCMASFHAGLSVDWREANQARSELVADLVKEVPDLKRGSNLLFVDFQHSHKRAVVFRGWLGLKELVRMLYDDPTLGAYYVFPFAWRTPNHRFQQAMISASGLVTRGIDLARPIPLDSLIVLARRGTKLTLLEKLTASDGQAPTGIAWDGIRSVTTNRSRVLGESYASINPGVSGPVSRSRDYISALRVATTILGFRFLNQRRAAVGSTFVSRGKLLKK